MDGSPQARTSLPWRRLARGLQGGAGLIGAAGVGVAALAAHAGGGTLANTAATFMLVHAAAMVGSTAAWATGAGGRRLLVAASFLGLGVVLFSGELALADLAGLRPWPQAAPIGGLMLILGWLCIALSPFGFRR